MPSITHSLLNAAIHSPLDVLAGAAVGRVLAGALRARGLHWSWCLTGAAPAVLMLDLAPAAGIVGVAALLVATRLGLRWQRHDCERGGDLARAAEVRRTPFDFVRQCVAARSVPTMGELVLGCDRRGRPVAMPLGGPSGSHALVVGATGSGKTVTQRVIAEAAIARGMGVVFVDPKGDEDLRAALRAAAAVTGAAFYEWSPEGPAVFNPLAHGGDSEIADKALAGERYTEPHYLRQAQRYLGHEVRALRAAGVEVSVSALVRHLDPPELEVLSRRLPVEAASVLQRYLDSLTPRQQRDLAGTRDRLGVLAESDAGRWLDPDRPGPRFDVAGAVAERAVCLFRLDADRHPLLASMLGAAVVGDLRTAAAARQRDPLPTLIVVDEFSAVAAHEVARLFGRARSAGFSVVLGTQELSDLRAPATEALRDQVIGNLSTLIAHRQVVPASADLVAAVAGRRGAWDHSDRLERGRIAATSRRRVQEPVLDAAALQGLPPGWAAVIVPGGTQPPALARIAAGRLSVPRCEGPLAAEAER
jgi:TraM recognition site of TraD and TraG/Bacterial protein of unknown function (DUF853)